MQILIDWGKAKVFRLHPSIDCIIPSVQRCVYNRIKAHTYSCSRHALFQTVRRSDMHKLPHPAGVERDDGQRCGM